MTPENSKFVIQCSSCSAKLQVGVSAMGKTIACPKCGHQMKIKDNPKPVDDPVVARPVASSAMPSKPAVAQLSILVLARPHRYSQTINPPTINP